MQNVPNMFLVIELLEEVPSTIEKTSMGVVYEITSE